MRGIKSLCAVTALLLSSSAWAKSPFIVVTPGKLQRLASSVDGILFEHDGFKVMRASTAGVSDFNQLYWVHLSPKHTKALRLQEFGTTMHEQPGSFAIMRLDDTQVERLSAALHESGMACGAVFKLEGDLAPVTVTADAVPKIPIDSRIAGLGEVVAQVSADRIKAGVTELSNIDTRYHGSPTGKTVADHLATTYRALAQNRDDVTIEAFDHGSNTPQPSLVVRITGRTTPNEIIILGSHIDSVNWSDGTSARSPGADDNASGTATNLEIFRVMMEQGMALDRTLEIHGYAAEEIGLVGSQDMASKYRRANKQVVAMVQHDMNLYNAAGRDEIWLVSNNTNAAFNDALSKLIDQYVGVPWNKANLGGGNSDHYSWTRQGYVAAFPFENPRSYNSAIHTSNDTIANANRFGQAAAFAKLGLAYVAHFGGLESSKR